MRSLPYSRLFMYLGLGLVIVLVGCGNTGPDEDGRVVYSDSVLTLVDIADAESYSLDADARGPEASARARKPAHPAPGGAIISLVATVTSPKTPDGSLLQASHVALTANGKYAFVAYMLRGAQNYGALDLFDVSVPSAPALLSTDVFPDFDIAAVVEESGRVFLAGQKVDQSGDGNSAYVMAMPYRGSGSVDSASAVSRSLPGYFATDLVHQNGILYVTTGTAGPATDKVGLFALDPSTLQDAADATQRNSDYPDLRSVAVAGAGIAAFSAQYSSQSLSQTYARLDIYTDKLASLSASIDLVGYPATAEAKSKIAYYGSLVLVAANRSGLVIVDPTGAIRASIPAPSLPASLVAEENQSTNAVSCGAAGSKDIVFIANGEAGLWVGDGDLLLGQTAMKDTASVAGSIRFGAGQSVNYVACKKSLVVAAVGTGGLKVLNLKEAGR